MINRGKYNILGSNISACDYDFILKQAGQALSKPHQILLIAPVASLTLTKAYFNEHLRQVLSNFNYLVPDSQWVKRAIFLLHGVYLKERIYGPELALRLCQLANRRGYRVFLYGGERQTLLKLKNRLKKLFPKIAIVGYQPSKLDPLTNKFIRLTEKDKRLLLRRLISSKSDIIFIGLGSPLQETFAYELFIGKKGWKKSLVVVTVGAAFDFISLNKPQAPMWMQDAGLESLFRLLQEPRRLWKRYLIFGPLFLLLVLRQKNLCSRLFAAVTLIILSPVMLIILAIVSLSDDKAPIFKQQRVGKNKKTFNIYKIRTMVKGAESLKPKYAKMNEADGPVFKIRNDPRYTRIGKFLSHTGLDELPQLINIIKGEMAFVGPRPLPVEEALKIPKKYHKRFNALPGITSSWVISGAHKLSFDEWMKLDLEYVDSKSLYIDAKIILQTLAMVIKMIANKLRGKDV